MTKTHKLAVYGTLRPGLSDNVVTIPGLMFSLGSYPGVKLDVEGFTFKAEIVEVTEEKLRELDRYEGYYEKNHEQSLYIRRNYTLDSQGFWIYEYNWLPKADTIEGGDWLAYVGTQAGRASNFLLGD